MRFADRSQAGQVLAERLAPRNLDVPLVLALPRGGIPVAEQVARGLGGDLDIVVARKIGAPGQAELGIGAVGEGGTVIADTAALRSRRVSRALFDALVEAEWEEVSRRVQRYRAGRPLPELGGRDVVLVDDGLATGVTAEAALRDLRRAGPRTLVLAAPVCSTDAVGRLRPLADDIVCAHVPPRLRSVGEWYDRFDQSSDAELLAVLGRFRPSPDEVSLSRPPPSAGGGTGRRQR